MADVILFGALLIMLGAWIGLGLVLYRDHQEERRRFTEEWRKRMERSESDDFRLCSKNDEYIQ